MLIRIEQKSEVPLYLQIRSQIIEAIARGEMEVDSTLPSVRSLAQDLGINLHTVNKAYAVLRDEGYILIKGRKGAVVADPLATTKSNKAQAENDKLEEGLRSLALSAKAHGVSEEQFGELARKQIAFVYEGEKVS